LEDARGESFSSEIDSLHEQIGARLNQVNVMLAGLSLQDEDPAPPASGSLVPPPHSRRRNQREIPAEAPFGFDPEPAPGETGSAAIKYPASSYPLFIQDIVRRDLPSAGRRLAEVLGTTPSQGEHYATRFREQLDQDPGFLAKVHSLRQALEWEYDDQAKELLTECFGLEGLECTAAMQLLRGWL
jgi:hypothetical protein